MDDTEATWTKLTRWIRTRIYSVEAFLKEADTFKNTAQKRGHNTRIAGLILEARRKLLERPWDDTITLEYDTLWASLEHATLRNTILAQRLESDQVGGTKGDKTVGVDVFCENHGYRSTLGGGTIDHVNHDVLLIM